MIPVNVKMSCDGCGWCGGGLYLPVHPPVGSRRACPACGKHKARVLAPRDNVAGYASVKLEGARLNAELDRRAADHNIRVALPAHFEQFNQPVPARIRNNAEKRKARAKAAL